MYRKMDTHTAVQDKILLEAGTNELEVMGFRLRWKDPLTGECVRVPFGINAAKVKELVALPDTLTRLPDTHPCVRGVFLLRGQTVPLIDLCAWFGREPDEDHVPDKNCVVLVAEMNLKRFGFLVHGVDKVHRVSWKRIQSPPELIARYQSIVATTIIEGGLIQLIDFERIIAEIDPAMDLKARISARTAEDAENDDHMGTIVVAEDSAVIRQQMLGALKMAGYDVTACPDGLYAWEFLEELKKKGEAAESVLGVVTDIEMPRMDGHHLCKRIKDDPELNAIPVILFSSLINDMLRKKGESVGADEQITKPELDYLVDRIRDCIRKKKQRGRGEKSQES